MAEALILAAGRGARLRPLTDSTPKPLVEIGGQTLIDRHLAALAAAGVRRVIINLGWLGEKIVEHVGSGHQHGVNVVYSPEGFPTLDTGGAIMRALPLIGSDAFWVVNADVWTDFVDYDAARYLRDFSAAIALVPNPDYRDHGDFSLRDDHASNDPMDAQTFAGISVYRREFFASLPDGRFSIVPALRSAADNGLLGGFALSARWFDVGTAERLDAVRRAVS